MPDNPVNRYKRIVEHIFFDAAFGNYSPGTTEIAFVREQIEQAAAALNLKLPKNLGDVVYAIRYRTQMPQRILDTQQSGTEWVIEGVGSGLYKFVLVPINRIVPNRELATIKIPDATPEIITAYALNDEQALLAKVRYNRLIDTFLGVTAYSLQNHARTTVVGIGQIEIDEIYVGLDRRGAQYIIPVQAKAGRDQLSVIQTKQDLACCSEKFARSACRCVSAQFMDSNRIAMFELAVERERVVIVDEKHYLLVPSTEISDDDLARYGRPPSS